MPALPDSASPTLLDGVNNARILVVDDNRINRNLLIALLERGGFRNIATAGDGVEMLACIPEFRPDLLLLDLMMPNLDGFEACRRLRAIPDYRDMPVLVQSSLSRAEDRARAFAMGATDYVTKPLNPAELLSRVRIHLENRAMLRRLQLYRQRAEAELTLAQYMQEGLLPPPALLTRLEQQTGVRVSAHFAPSSELGGDYWDVRVDATGRLIVWLVDFSGHGVGAALNTFRLHTLLRPLTFDSFDPATFLATINQKLCPLLPRGQFATMLAGIIDPAHDHFLYASAGATRPMSWTPGDSCPHSGDSSGLPLGLLPGATYENRITPLPPQGRLFLYSDAAVELPLHDNPNSVLDEDGLIATVAALLHNPDDTVFLPRLMEALAGKGHFDDDLTAVLLTRRR